MENLTTQHLAELLVGIARTQQAIIDAIESQKAGFKMTHLGPALQTAARIRNTGHTPSLMDFPARVLLQHQNRSGPDVAQIARDLEVLLAQQLQPADSSPAQSSGAA